MKCRAFHSSYFFGKKHFEDDGAQDYLSFQPVLRYLKEIANSDNISARKSKGLSNESINLLAAPNNIFAAALNYIHTKIRLTYDGSTLKTGKNHIYT